MTSPKIDRRLTRLSYSSRETFAICPRKYELYKLTKRPEETQERHNSSSGITFSFGHAVGAGVQAVLNSSQDNDAIVLATAMAWSSDLLAYNDKSKKSLFHAILAVQKFQAAYSCGLLEGWEILSGPQVAELFGVEKAAEVPFAIHLPNGYVYIGYVDAILWNPETGQVMILELKTTGSKVISSATYKNSSQALGYSVVLDKLFPELSSYTVKYMVYSTTLEEWSILDFGKSYLQRALWLQELWMDTQQIDTYATAGVFPMRGGSCRHFNQDCQYFESPACTMSNTYITDALTEDWNAKLDAELAGIKFHVSFEELVQAQLIKE